MYNSIPTWLMNLVFYFAARWKALADFIQTAIVNSSVSLVPFRPDPYSTVHPYISWTSLTDLSWSARHLPPKTIPNLPPFADLKEIFETPPGGQTECPKSTLLFPAFAQYLTDGIIRTRMPNASQNESPQLRKRNTSNHQFEMGSLYGRLAEHTHALRQKSEVRGERGRLKSQMIEGEEYPPFLYDGNDQVKSEFKGLDSVVSIDKATADKRRTLFAVGGDRVNVAPHVSMLNVLFLREHNRLAAQIEKDHPNWDDERIFETARNTIIVLFIKIGIEEYVNHITPLKFKLKASPQSAWTAPWNRPNRIAIEFSLLYRWHSLIPATVKWNGTAIPIEDTLLNNKLLIDAGLRSAFEQVSSQNAMRLGLRNTTSALIAFEERAIEQSRVCEVASFADYCRNTSTEPPAKFEDISSDPEIVAMLRKHYRSPEDVEFYIGLFGEDTLKNSPLPDMMLKLAAMDAFSHAFTNPLLSERAFQESTFSEAGWKAIGDTTRLSELIERNCPDNQKPSGYIGITRNDWKREREIPVWDEFKETVELRKTPTGRIKLAGFALSTIGEALGLVLWLYFTMAGSPVIGFAFLVAGELIEWSLLAVAIATSPRSYPKQAGKVPRALFTSGLTSLSEAFLWLGWFLLIPHTGLLLATVGLLVTMHIKHVTEISIFSGRSFKYHAWDSRDITASVIETFGAAVWFCIAASYSPILGAAVLLAVIFAEHLLQFKSAGFMSKEA